MTPMGNITTYGYLISKEIIGYLNLYKKHICRKLRRAGYNVDDAWKKFTDQASKSYIPFFFIGMGSAAPLFDDD